MAEKFRGKYRIPSTRAQWWDYSRNGIYYITFCTKDRRFYFGNILNHTMILSDIGIMARQFWSEIPSHFPNVLLDEFVIMPNHIHGIILIRNDAGGGNTRNDGGTDVFVQTLHATSLQQPSQPPQPPPPPKNQIMSGISPSPGSLPVVIRSYKSALTKYCNEKKWIFGWQPRYHDHIIRDVGELQRIRKYIMENPEKWKNDEFY
jgi:REP element-mobilizing transposase RayT